jgi:hypothetical protein
MNGSIAGLGTVFNVLVLASLIAMGAGLWFTLAQRQDARRGTERLASDVPTPTSAVQSSRAYSRPWWGNPWLWVVVCLTFAVLGLVVWPGLFGGTILLLPFVWIRRSRREADMDPRTNGHTERDPETFTGD